MLTGFADSALSGFVLFLMTTFSFGGSASPLGAGYAIEARTRVVVFETALADARTRRREEEEEEEDAASARTAPAQSADALMLSVCVAIVRARYCDRRRRAIGSKDRDSTTARDCFRVDVDDVDGDGERASDFGVVRRGSARAIRGNGKRRRRRRRVRTDREGWA
jgi:hypothetical protein